MQIIFAGVCFIGGVAAMVFLSSMGLNSWLKAAVIFPLVLLIVYSLARIQPKEDHKDNVR